MRQHNCWSNVNGDELVNEVVLEIGGQEIDKQTKEWMQVWTELSTPDSKAAGVKYMTGAFTNSLNSGTDWSTTHSSSTSILILPQPWSCSSTYCSSIPRSQIEIYMGYFNQCW